MPVESSWLDEHAERVIAMLRSIPDRKRFTKAHIQKLLDSDFSTGITVARLLADLSKDEFTIRMKEVLGTDGGVGVTRFKNDKEAYLSALAELGVVRNLTRSLNETLHWTDKFVERLKVGRGSAIKGQQRGRGMEDFVESIIGRVFDPADVVARCRFTGAKGTSTEKADFAIPCAEDPRILIEVKAYGATGSKQTDVLGDISRIVEEKRNDTVFFLVTDGISWKERPNDLRKLVALQNEGAIQMIYTKSMASELEADLRSLKGSYKL